MKKGVVLWGLCVFILAFIVCKASATGAYRAFDYWEKIPQAEKYTQEEKEILLRIATAEGESEGADGMYRVLEVVINRVNSDRYPDTIKGVVFQDYPCVQFESTANGRYKNCEITEDAKNAYDHLNSIGVLDKRIVAFEHVSGNVLSRWYEYLYSVGNHRFYCEKGATE